MDGGWSPAWRRNHSLLPRFCSAASTELAGPDLVSRISARRLTDTCISQCGQVLFLRTFSTESAWGQWALAGRLQLHSLFSGVGGWPLCPVCLVCLSVSPGALNSCPVPACLLHGVTDVRLRPQKLQPLSRDLLLSSKLSPRLLTARFECVFNP